MVVLQTQASYGLAGKTTTYGQPRDLLKLSTFNIPVSETINEPYGKLNCLFSLFNKLKKRKKKTILHHSPTPTILSADVLKLFNCFWLIDQ